jgi:putative peptide zinc metalloprotease protein
MDEFSSTEKVRMRRELEFLPLEDAAAKRWCVFDPISRQSYRVGWKEKWFLSSAKTSQSRLELVQAFRRAFPKDQDSTTTLHKLVLQLVNSGLMRRERASLSSNGSSFSGAATSWLSKIVVLQVRGFQPERLLQRLAPHTDVFFAARAVTFWLAFALFATSIVLLNFERLRLEIGTTGSWLHPAIGGSLFVVFVLTRGLHELGHALVCTRFGIRCPDIGLFLILGAPCVYCDVSESWRLTEKWKRAAVAAAGMYVELIIAGAAALFWSFTTQGPMHSLAMQTMLVCSAGTLLINLNPLMRFDGYYILSDWMDEANLRTKADEFATGFLKKCLLGIRTPANPVPFAKRVFFVSFSISGWVYRAVLAITIASVVVAMFSSWQLPWLGRGLAIAILFSWWSGTVMKLVEGFLLHVMTSRWRLASLCCGLILLLLVAPLPSRRMARGWIEPQNFSGIYVQNAGQLKNCFVEDGSNVEAGEKLFQFSSPELELQQIGMRHALAMAETQQLHIKYANELDRPEEPDIYSSELTHARARMQDAVARTESLTCVAPSAGKWISFPATPAGGPWATELRSESRHTSWCDAEQLGRTLPAGTLLGAVCSDRLHAVVELETWQLQDVSAGTAARIRIRQQEHAIVHSLVKAIVELDSFKTTWRPAKGDLSVTSSAPQFAAIVELPSSVAALPGCSVDVVFVGRPTRVATRLYRWMRTNLNLLAD